MLDGKAVPTYGLSHAFRDRFKDLRSGQRVTTDYMDIRYYNCGTIHFFPHGTKLIDRLNRLVGARRRWLPPEGEKVNEAFWLQYDQAASFDAAYARFQTELAQPPASPETAAGPTASGFASGDVLVARIARVKLLSEAQPAARALGQLAKDEEVIFLGEAQGRYLKVRGADVEGWADQALLARP